MKNIRSFPEGTRFIVEEVNTDGTPLSGNMITANGKTYEITVSDGSGTAGAASYTGTTGSTYAPEISFTNKRVEAVLATLKVKKAIAQGQTWPSGRSATFTLSPVTDGAPMPSAGGTTVTLFNASEGSFGSIAYTRADVGKTYEYEITETTGFGQTSPDKITATVAVADVNGTLKTTVTYDPESDTITNTYIASGAISLGVEKTMKNNYWPAGTTNFPFTLEGPKISGKLTAYAKQDDPAVFTEIEYKLGDVTETQRTPYTYTITEACPPSYAEAGVTCSTTPIVVSVTLKDNGNGTISPEAVTVNGQPVPTETLSGKTVYVAGSVENSYSAKGSGEIKVKKILKGREWKSDDSFTFTLEKVNETAPMPSVTEITIKKENKDYTASFGTFDFPGPGTYQYKVLEKKGTIDGITYDETEHPVTIVVKDDGNGHLVADTGSELVQTVESTNTYDASGNARLNVKKKVAEGQSWPDGAKATFTLTARTAGAPMPDPDGKTVTLDETNREGSFGEITYILDNAGNRGSQGSFRGEGRESQLGTVFQLVQPCLSALFACT